ncbi:MAG: hypothetical protein NC390_01265 [Fusobacterium sp.]|nr:hypothetical protein [Fusobacterium sp.]
MINFDEGIEFDPGFTIHLSLISRDVESFYYNLNMYQFAQKKQQFKAYSGKLWRLIERNIGFYAACVLWADIAKNYPEKLILNNICFGGEYDEAENVQEVEFVRNYLEQFKKDMKYYVGQNFEIPEIYSSILDDYEAFLKLNEGFIKVSKADDLKLPEGVKSVENEAELLSQIENVIESGNFKPMIEYYSKVK